MKTEILFWTIRGRNVNLYIYIKRKIWFSRKAKANDTAWEGCYRQGDFSKHLLKWLAWQCARPNAIVTVVALYDKAQALPLPNMYGKNLTFKTGGVDGCDCEETLKLIDKGKLDTEPLITHIYPLSRIEEAYELFENKRDGVIKIAVEC